MNAPEIIAIAVSASATASAGILACAARKIVADVRDAVSAGCTVSLTLSIKPPVAPKAEPSPALSTASGITPAEPAANGLTAVGGAGW